MANVVTRAGCSLAVGASLVGLALLTPAQGRQAMPGPNHAARSSAKPPKGTFTKALVRELRRRDLQVTTGYTHLWTQSDCGKYTYPTFRNCWANNPASPYQTVTVKRWPDEYVDPRTANAFGKTRPGYTGVPRLDPREAIVIFGRMPPRARYFGLQTWVFTMQDRWDATAYNKIAKVQPDLVQYLFSPVPPGPKQTGRLISFSSVNNNINDVTIKRRSGSVWNQNRYFVVTADRNMNRAVRRSLERLGVGRRHVLTDAIPPKDEKLPIGPIGLGKRDNDFATWFRYAMPKNKKAGDAWFKNPPLTVLRVRERPSSPRAAKPFPPFFLAPRTAVPEQALAGPQEQLVKAVCARAARTGKLSVKNSGCGETAPFPRSTMHDLLTELGQSGPQCRSIGMDCLGDNQDASYFFAPARPLDGGQVYAVVGTLATETGNGTYVGLSVNDASMLKGVVNVPDTDTGAPRTDLAGSANGYRKVKHRDEFFVHFFSRDCRGLRGLTGATCTTLTTAMVPKAGDTSAEGDPRLHGKVNFALRAYVKPGTARGPDSRLQLKGRVLTFVRR